MPEIICTRVHIVAVKIRRLYHGTMNTDQGVSLKKYDDELQVVYGEVYSPDVPDAQADFMSEGEIQKMAHRFMGNLAQKMIDENHNNEVNGSMVVESFIAREGDPTFIPGSWVVGVHVPDAELWHKVKSGELNGFSFEGMVKSKKDIILEIDVPEVLVGHTLKTDDIDHTHEYQLKFMDNGKVSGGRTSIVNGHYHEIKSHTMTEEAEGHSHRFSFVEAL